MYFIFFSQFPCFLVSGSFLHVIFDFIFHFNYLLFLYYFEFWHFWTKKKYIYIFMRTTWIFFFLFFVNLFYFLVQSFFLCLFCLADFQYFDEIFSECICFVYFSLPLFSTLLTPISWQYLAHVKLGNQLLKKIRNKHCEWNFKISTL